MNILSTSAVGERDHSAPARLELSRRDGGCYVAKRVSRFTVQKVGKVSMKIAKCIKVLLAGISAKFPCETEPHLIIIISPGSHLEIP